MGKPRPKKLTRREKDILRGLEQEMRKQTIELNNAKERSEWQCNEDIKKATRSSVESARGAADEFANEKRKIDNRKEIELKKVERGYQSKLKSLREQKGRKLAEIEDQLEQKKTALQGEHEERVKKLEAEFEKVMKENRVKQERIRHSVESKKEKKDDVSRAANSPQP